MAQARGDEKPAQRPRRGVLGTVLYGLFSLGLIGLVAWVLLLVWFCTCRVYQGELKTMERMNAIVEINAALLSVNDCYSTFQSVKEWTLMKVLLETHVLQGMEYAENKLQKIQILLPGIHASVQHSWQQVIRPFFTVLCGVTIILGARLFILLLAVPLFVVLLGMGLVDALVQRDIRKFQGARESTYLFHRMKRSWIGSFSLPLLMYLAWPWAVSPLWFLLPMAVWLAIVIQVGLRSFKKYL